MELITKIYIKITEIINSTEPITRAQRITLSTALQQLQQNQRAGHEDHKRDY